MNDKTEIVSHKNINVIDSIMGSGKSTYLIQKLAYDHAKRTFANKCNDGWTKAEDPHTGLFTDTQLPIPKYLVLVPLLSEVKRYTDALPELQFENPQPIGGKKLNHLKELIVDGRNIVTTHALFKLLNRDIYEEIIKQRYTLIIDECLDAVSMFEDLTKDDINTVFETEMITVNSTNNRLEWNYTKHPKYAGKFSYIKSLCDIGSLVIYADKKGKSERTILLWQFPSEFISCFDDVWIATYLYYGSPFSAYLQAEGFTVTRFYTRGGISPQLLPFTDTDTLSISSQGDREIRSAIASLIDIHEGPINEVGSAETVLSRTWYSKATEDDINKLKNNTYNFFKYYAPTSPIKKQDPALNSKGLLKNPDKMISVPSNGWTCFSEYKDRLKGKGYTKGWIANNAKATNDYAHMTSMAYLCNWYPSPVIHNYFSRLGITLNKEAYALSGLIQWLWRSKIRTMEEPIKVYIPSSRMRTLLKDWLAGKDFGQEGNDIVDKAR